MCALDLIKPYTPITFGSAAFLSLVESIQCGLNNKGEKKSLSPYLGVLVDRRTPGIGSINLYAKSEGHLLTVAPTRAGKGRGQIIPNLLSWQGSAIVIDIKGENYLKTAGYRAEKLKQRVIRFAPFEKESERWNPLMSIRANRREENGTKEEQEDVRYLSNLLIAPSGSENDKFWENSAKNFLEGLILHVRTADLTDDPTDNDPTSECLVRERSMREVRRLLTSEEATFEELLAQMMKSKRAIVKQSGSSMSRQLRGDGKIGTSILAVAEEQTSVWAYDRLQDVTYIPPSGGIFHGSFPEKEYGLPPSGIVGEPGKNDFDFKGLRDCNTTLYIIVPPDYLTEYRTVLRVLIGIAMRELRQNHYSHEDIPPVLFILDEFPQLAYMRPIEEALLYMAGYGARFWFFVQDISQLQLHYPKSWRTFMANTGTQSFFGVSDIQTANLVSEMAGTATVMNRGFGYNVGWQESKSSSYTHGGSDSTTSGPGLFNSSSSSGSSWSNTTGTSTSVSEGVSTQLNFVGRRLITPDEAMRLHEYEQIIFTKGMKPIRCSLPPYYWHDEMDNDSKKKPPKEVSFS